MILNWNNESSELSFPSAYEDMVRLPRWLCWRFENGKKVPYAVKRPKKPANPLVRSNWSEHHKAISHAIENEVDGIGFVLNGDGIVAIDLDDCVEDGCIDPKAMEIMQELGCRLVEISPSETGLHGFGYGPKLNKGVRGKYKGISVELFSDRRYITVTGQLVIGEGLVQLAGFDQLAQTLCGKLTEATEATETTEATESRGALFNENLNEIEIPSSCIPRHYGSRNNCIFRLACFLKSAYPTASADDLLPVVQRWHLMALPNIRTKDFEESWVDFRVAWKNSTHQYGSLLESALSDLPEVPPSMMKESYGPRTKQLIRICLALQRHAGTTPFFLGCRKAGELIKVSHTSAANFLQMLVDDSILKVVTKGNGQQASRYLTIQL